jgi:arylsulfatase A-like enzyme
MNLPITRRDFLHILGSAGASISIPLIKGCSHSTPEISKPNILFILADDLGYGDLECYGQEKIKTPFINQLAREGMRFTDFYAGSTVCAPSRCSLMTGLHTGHTFVRGNKEIKPMGQVAIPAETKTVAEYLKEAGYNTALIGKWGLGAPGTEGIPNQQGFDYFLGYLCQRHAHNYYPEFLFRNDQRVPLEGNRVDNDRLDGAGLAKEKVHYSHDLLAEDALKFIENNSDGPFFLYLAVTLPHANNEAGNNGMEVPDLGIYGREDWPEPEKGKAAMITRLDKDVGRILNKMKELGIEKNTVVFFTSDNGPHQEGGVQPEFFKSSGSLRGIKRDLYEGGIRVPMIVRWPEKIKGDTTSRQVFAFWDFLPTACEIAGLPSPKTIDGISFLPALRGKPNKQHEYLYWEFHERNPVQAVRMGKWKGIRFVNQKVTELYDLENDIGEITDVAEQHPDVVQQLNQILNKARIPSEIFPFAADTP